MKILFVSPDPKPQRWITLLQAALPDAQWIVWHADLPPQQADYALVWQPPAELFEREPGLKALFNLGAGVDALLRLPALPRTLPIYRLEDAGMSAQMAEYLLHQIAEITRSMPVYRQQQQQQIWKMQPPCRRHEWPIGFLGLGHISQKAARLLQLLEYPVSCWSRSPKQLDGIHSYSGDNELPAFLKNTRILINTLPLTPETAGCLNQSLFTQLPPNSVLINVGRGQHLQEQDLLSALDSGTLQQAVLDVFATEPLPAEHPFWKHPKITLTPHMSAPTLREETVRQITDKLKALAQGLTITGEVDRQRGY